MLVATVFEVACGVYPGGYWTLPDTAAPACKVLIAQLRAVVALKELVCWFGVHHVCRKGQSPTAWPFQGKRKVLDRKEVFIMDGLVFFWNELGQGGDQERGEAPLGVRRC